MTITLIEHWNTIIGDIVWGPAMLILLVGTGVLFSLGTGFLQVRKLGYIFRHTVGTLFEGRTTVHSGTISPFQALTTALAGTVGTGNIAGVATAIVAGGPGALFWMWVSAFFGMMTKYAEILLAVHYREVNGKGAYVGGPMYYLSNGLNMKWLATAFSVFCLLAAFGIGNMTQVNSIVTALQSTLGIPVHYAGAALAGLAGLVVLGGITRIASLTEKIVPLMATLYLGTCLLFLVVNWRALPATFGLIFSSALQPTAAVGGFAGATVMMAMRNGVARGVFSNEAGLGSAPMVHAAAQTDHPAKQAMWGVFEVFLDTIVVCSATGLVILSSDLWSSGLDGIALTIAAFSTVFPQFAGGLVTISIFAFAFSTLIGWSYYGERSLEFLTGTTRFNWLFRLVFVLFILVGAQVKVSLVWELADTVNGCMAIPNLVGILGLSGVVFSTTRDYFKKK